MDLRRIVFVALSPIIDGLMSQISFAYENPLKLQFGESFFKELPKSAGVYFFLDEERTPLYIGKADCLRKRLCSYKNAKPGSVPDHTLEMIEHAREIVFELHSDGKAALRREGELIRALKPPFNIAGTDPIPFLHIGLGIDEPQSSGFTTVDFRLSHREPSRGFEVYGCYMHRGKTKSGYSALLRLFFAASLLRSRLHLPAKLCRTSPLYVYRGEVPTALIRPLRRFLRGESADLLHLLMRRLLENEDLSPLLYAPLQRDLQMAREFFLTGPTVTRKLLKSIGKEKSYVSHAQMEKVASDQYKDVIRELTAVSS